MTAKDLKLKVYHYRDERGRAIIINTAQQVISILRRIENGNVRAIDAELTEDLGWKPQETVNYTPLDKMTLNAVLRDFKKNTAYRYACEHAEIERLQQKIEKRLQEISDMEKEIERIQS